MLSKPPRSTEDEHEPFELQESKDEEAEQQTITVESSDDESLFVDLRCNPNIYNAFLSIYHRDDLKFKGDEDVQRDIKYGLCAFAYAVAVLQWVGIFLLMRIIMISSGQSIFDLQFYWMPQSINTIFMYPFFVMAWMQCLNENKDAFESALVLRTWGMSRRLFPSHEFSLNLLTDNYLSFFGSIMYFLVLALYSGGSGDWENLLNTILNLLAYQFVTSSDESAFAFISTHLRRRTTLDNLEDLFLPKGKVDMSRSKKGRIWRVLQNVIGWPFLFQGIFSRSYLLLVLFGVVLLLWVQWCFIRCCTISTKQR